MEKLKDFFKSPKYTALLGLTGSIIMLLPIIFIIDTNFLFGSILSGILNSILGIGFLLYFIVFLLRLHTNKGNIKVANTFLLITIILQFILLIGYIPKTLYTIIIFLIFTGFFMYFINIFYMKNNFFNNIYFLIIIVLYILFVFSNIYQLIGMVAITPYFYNYYNFLKKEGSIK